MYKPYAVSLYLSSYCNFDCSYCVYGKMRKAHMDYNHAIKRIDEAIELGVRFFGISGGEPSLNPRWLDIINYLIRKDVQISFISNGANVKEEDLRQIAYYPKISFWFSLDSHVENINDDLRCKGAYKQTLEYIGRLKNVNPNAFKVNIGLVTNSNLDSFGKTVKFVLIEQGFQQFKAERPMILDNCIDIKKEDLIDDTKKYVQKMSEINREYPHFFPNISSHNKCCFINKERFHILIYPEGDIYPCCYIIDSDLRIGSKDDKLNDILEKNVECKHNKVDNNFFKGYNDRVSRGLMFGCVECVEEYKRT